MSGHLEERLREAAARGDLQEVQALLHAGAEVNAPNEVDGWTCLHWACKRNHIQVVAYLLDAGADKEIATSAGELAVQLTSKKEIRKIMGEDNQEVNACNSWSMYLTNAPSSCTSDQERGNIPNTSAASQDIGIAISCSPEGEPHPCLSATHVENVCDPTLLHSEMELPGEDRCDGELASTTSTGASEQTKPEVNNCPVYLPSVCHNRAPFMSIASRQLVPQQASGSYMGTTPPVQPLLLTGTFPYNVQELVLKVRVQNPKESDFIEIELDRQELTYQDLLRVSCCELGVNPEQVEKIRKLPNTLVRKDKDVARLQDFQELELVVMRSINSAFRNTATLMEKSCFNTKAAKLTY
ncbi:ankyrin repeat domain-containing protein 40-like [Tiliqua scincoides]|uniref:ankyrin repeat domain-containing protein 40-like n=1 Tax=Tiliqua scincoides TaxID=71010 RepID=UPI00346329C1